MEALMNPKKIYLSSPAGASLVLLLKEGKSALPSYGMYRLEVDVVDAVSKSGLSDLLIRCLGHMEAVEHVIAGVHSGPEIDLRRPVTVVEKSKSGFVFEVDGQNFSDVIGVLATSPFGDIFFVGLSRETNLTSLAHVLTDMDSFVRLSGDSVSWALEYSESAVLTVLARKKTIVEKQLLSLIETGV